MFSILVRWVNTGTDLILKVAIYWCGVGFFISIGNYIRNGHRKKIIRGTLRTLISRLEQIEFKILTCFPSTSTEINRDCQSGFLLFNLRTIIILPAQELRKGERKRPIQLDSLPERRINPCRLATTND